MFFWNLQPPLKMRVGSPCQNHCFYENGCILYRINSLTSIWKECLFLNLFKNSSYANRQEAESITDDILDSLKENLSYQVIFRQAKLKPK